MSRKQNIRLASYLMMRLWRGILSMLLVLGFVSGCTPGPTGAASPRETGYHVQTVRLKESFTRMYQDNQGRLHVKTTVELRDPFGDSIKALGAFRFELFQYRPAYHDPRGARLKEGGMQTLDLSRLQENDSHWNRITRCYNFDFTLAELPYDTTRLVVQVTFSQEDYRLQDILVLERTGKDDVNTSFRPMGMGF
ncbi:MAG: hypothetical protein JW709_07470 [Sedimentisphaerales bacterium]|nr:hypothetical protein [Sedimentisphaerales bacterium]